VIWIGNAPGGVRYHDQVMEGGQCQCAACMVDRSGGLLSIGPVGRHPDTDIEDVRVQEAEGFVGLYRNGRKPWKRK
jgi:hypothetical protein